MKKTRFYPFLWMLLTVLVFSGSMPAGGEEKTPDPNSLPAAGESRSALPSANTEPNPDWAGEDPNSEGGLFEEQAESRIPAFFDLCDQIFSTYVTKDGLVRYAALRRNRGELLPVQRLLKELNPLHLMALPQEEKTAFWINVYNLCTLQLIIDNYPIQPKWYLFRYPSSSIMQIPNPWTKHYFWIQGLQYNLEEIEKEFLLRRTRDPRICFVLSYASLGGGRQRNEAYRGSKLEQQLDDQVRKYLQSPYGYRLDREEKVVYLSVLFQTKHETFLDSDYAAIRKFRDYPDLQRAWLNFLSCYISPEEVQFLETTLVTFKMITYNWQLDEAP